MSGLNSWFSKQSGQFSAKNCPQRTFYEMSGRVNLLRFVLGLVPALAAYYLIATLMGVLRLNSFHFMFISALLFAAAFAGVTFVFLKFSHCRSILFGVPVGMVLATGGYLFHFQMLVAISSGLQNGGVLQTVEVSARVDLLPQIISSVMQNEVWKDDHGPKNVQKQANTTWNWIHFGAELLFNAIGGAIAGYGVAHFAYCEKCKTWMKSKSISLPPAFAPLTAKHLLGGTLEQMPVPETSFLVAPKFDHALVAFDFCSHGQAAELGDYYLTVSSGKLTKDGHGNTNVVYSPIIKHVMLSPDEFAQIVTAIPSAMELFSK